VLLTFKKANGKHALVDGLQRVSTLLNYRENHFDFINENDFFKNDHLLEKFEVVKVLGDVSTQSSNNTKRVQLVKWKSKKRVILLNWISEGIQ
jgi:hypothetical protein